MSAAFVNAYLWTSTVGPGEWQFCDNAVLLQCVTNWIMRLRTSIPSRQKAKSCELRRSFVAVKPWFFNTAICSNRATEGASPPILEGLLYGSFHIQWITFKNFTATRYNTMRNLRKFCEVWTKPSSHARHKLISNWADVGRPLPRCGRLN